MMWNYLLVKLYVLKNMFVGRNSRRQRKQFYTGPRTRQAPPASPAVTSQDSPTSALLLVAALIVFTLITLGIFNLILPKSDILRGALIAAAIMLDWMVIKRIWASFNPTLGSPQPSHSSGWKIFIFLLVLAIVGVAVFSDETSPEASQVNVWVILTIVILSILAVLGFLIYLINQSSNTAGTLQTGAQPGTPGQKAGWGIGEKLKKFFWHTIAKRLYLIAFGIWVVNNLFYYALKEWNPTGDPYHDFYIQHYPLWIVLNASLFFFTFFALTKTEQGKYVDRLIWVALFVAILGYFMRPDNILSLPIFGSKSISAHDTTGITGEANPTLAALLVMQKWPHIDKLEDIAITRAAFPGDHVMGEAIPMCESTGKQFEDAAPTIPKKNHKKDSDGVEISTAQGLYQIIRPTYHSIGRIEFGMSPEEWENGGAAKHGYDWNTPEGNTKSAKWLFNRYGTKPWEADPLSKACWIRIAEVQYGSSRIEIANRTSEQMGVPVSVTPTGVRVIEVTAPAAPVWSKVYTWPQLPNSGVCAMPEQTDNAIVLRQVDQGAAFPPETRFRSAPIGEVVVGYGDRYQSKTGETVKFFVRIFPMSCDKVN